jgi:hypothetical protein
MSQHDASRGRLPRGVTALPRSRGGRGYRASIRRGKAGEVHLGLYESPWLAAFAYGVAAQLLGRERRGVEIPPTGQPTAEQVRSITAAVRRRLGLELETDADRQTTRDAPPALDDLLTFFEVTVVGFWRAQATADSGNHPGAGLDAAAGRLVEAAGLLFWSRPAGHPTPLEAMTRLLARRLDQAFRRADLTREVLDDDGDEPRRVARWLVYPDDVPGGRLRSFRDEIRHLYLALFQDATDGGDEPGWAVVLGVAPPFTPDRVRAAYRARSRDTHPDAGGTEAGFVRLREAYEAAMAYCSWRDD